MKPNLFETNSDVGRNPKFSKLPVVKNENFFFNFELRELVGKLLRKIGRYWYKLSLKVFSV